MVARIDAEAGGAGNPLSAGAGPTQAQDGGTCLSRRALLPLLAAPLLATACTSVTGVETPALLARLNPEEIDRIGRNIVAEFGGADPDARLQNYVTSIAALMLRVSTLPDRPIRVIVLNTPIVNIFPLPNRILFVSRGLLAALNNEAELAGVLAHAIAMLNNDTVEAHYLAARPYTAPGMIHKQIPAGTDLFNLSLPFYTPFLAPYDPRRTLGSDAMAVRMLANAGYEPAALATALATLRSGAQIEARDMNVEVGVDPLHYFTLYGRSEQVMVEAIRGTPPRAVTPMLADRESYLRIIDGLSVDHDPAVGVARGQLAINGNAGYAIEVPFGFRPSPGSEMIVARGPGGTGISVDTVEVGQLPRISIYLTEVLARPLTVQGLLRQVESFKVSGMDAATGHARLETSQGPADLRLVAIRLRPNRLARMLFVSPGALTQPLSQDFRRTTQSFRAATRAEVAEPLPRRIAVIRPGLGDTAESLAAAMPYETQQLERLFALNGITPGNSLAPSEPVKTVRR